MIAPIFCIVAWILNPLHKTQHLIFVNCFELLRNIAFKKQLPEDGHNRWPKHVGGYADYNII